MGRVAKYKKQKNLEAYKLSADDDYYVGEWEIPVNLQEKGLKGENVSKTAEERIPYAMRQIMKYKGEILTQFHCNLKLWLNQNLQNKMYPQRSVKEMKILLRKTNDKKKQRRTQKILNQTQATIKKLYLEYLFLLSF